MGCIRSLSRTLVRFAGGAALLTCFLVPTKAWAVFASQFSLSVGEEYNNNIFFEKKKEHDFITIITPTLSLYYAPAGEVEPTLNLNLSPSGYIYALHSDQNSFGANSAVSGSYTYRYSPRLNFTLFDTFSRQDSTRTGGLSGGFGVPGLPTTGGGGSSSQNLKDLTSGGTQLSNAVSFHGSYLYQPNISFTVDYTNRFESFMSQGGTDVFNTASVRGIYNWRQDHNLHAGYTIYIANSRNGDSCKYGKFDFGDDYFSNYNLQLSPTLSLSASTGLSFNTGGTGCSGSSPITNSSNITITKLWEKAFLTGGMTKGLTPSYGVSGASDTTSFFTNFTMRITEKLTATSNLNFELYDTNDGNFKTFQAGMGLQYAINTWLSTGLYYYFNWTDSGVSAKSTDLLSPGIVNSNSVFVNLTSRFDLWPNVGLARSMSLAARAPTLTTPFPTPTPPPPSTGTGTNPSTGPTP